uniref:integrator complex subunit 4-like n=1 Tax=Styela clava TaxID=7725 RepID=UPI001939BF72|nr:integrator complex subunit 4-like [Styela clava]
MKMAVHLKKRACEEFSHVIQSDLSTPKRLRLIKKSSNSTEKQTIVKVKDSDSSKEKLQSLIQFSKKLPIPPNQVRQNVLELLKLFANEKDSSVRTKIAWLIGNLCQTARFNALITLKSIISLLKSEKSSQVLSQLWSVLTNCAKILPNERELHETLVELACKTLLSKNHKVRSECLILIGNLGKIEKSTEPCSSKSNKVNIQTLLGDFFGDQEPRVRCSALQAMILLHQRRQNLELHVYNQACSALSDDYEAVRVAALKLVWIMSNIYPESEVSVSMSDEKLRLVDDAFVKLCDMVNDSSYKVRAAAAGLLGSMHLVSNSFLFQTLDKKLMSDLKKKKSLNEKAKEAYVGEFSSGAKWADDAPKEVDTEANQLIIGGACGAFVHSLEDEMLEVRTAAVDSLTELACHRINSKFPQAALDFLVDCLNDEIEAVRLNAVNSLHKIMQNVALLEDQLENVLAGMEDFCVEIREGIHLLLSNCTLTSKFCLNDTIMKLLKNLNKYPQDRMSIWKAYKHIGKHHSQLVYLLVPHLLSCHPYFDMPEPKMDDPGYIGVLILVFNAAELCPKMTQIFPEHVVRHYQYLRDSIPDLVPQEIKLTTFANGDESCMNSPPRRSEGASDPAEFLNKALQRVKNLQLHDSRTQKSLLTCTINDLKHISNIAPKLSSTATSSANFLQAQLLLSEIVDTRAWSGSALACTQHLESTRPAARKIERLTQELEHLFLGLSTDEIALLRQMCLKAQSLEFLMDMQNLMNQKDVSTSSLSLRCQKFFNTIKDVHQYLETHNHIPDSFSKTLFNEVLKLDPTKKYSLVIKLLQPLLLHYSVSNVTFSNKVRESKVVVHTPLSRTDSSISFSAGLTTALDVDATSTNIPNPLRDVRIQIKYPDSTVQMVLLKPQDIKQISAMEHRIITKVFISHQQWTDACLIKMQFVKVFNTGRSHEEGSNIGILPLSKTVEILLHPKPTIRA